jgi:hypothetical protein
MKWECFEQSTNKQTYKKLQEAQKTKGHGSNCAATYNVELRQLSLFHLFYIIKEFSEGQLPCYIFGDTSRA